VRLLAAAVLIACVGCSERAPEAPATSAATPASQPPRPLVTTSASAIETAPGYRSYTNSWNMTADIPPGFGFTSRPNDTLLTNGRGAKISFTAGPLCNRTLSEMCSGNEKGWTRKVTATTCFETGPVGDKLSWSRSRLVGEQMVYSVTIVYPVAERVRFDEIIERVSRSWTVPTEAGGFLCGPTRMPDGEAIPED